MYDELKNRVKVKAGIDHVSPADCKRIAIEIFETTKKRISVSTLKRFFGFVSAKHKSAKYTLSVLSEYAESDCFMVINTKINPAKVKGKESAPIKFDLQDGNLQANQCIDKSDLEKLRESAQKSLPISIKLTKKQTKELIKNIK